MKLKQSMLNRKNGAEKLLLNLFVITLEEEQSMEYRKSGVDVVLLIP